MTKPGRSESSPDLHPAIRHAAPRRDENDAYSFKLVAGADYVLEEGKSVVLTQAGLERMVEAHTAGRDVIIEVGGVVIFRLPAWWGD
jgi:hypothetical protein